MKKNNSLNKEQEILNQQTEFVCYALMDAINDLQEECVKRFGQPHPAAVPVALGKLLSITFAQLTRDYDDAKTNIVLKPFLSKIEHEVLHNKKSLLKYIQLDNKAS